MRAIQRLELIDRIGRELQRRFRYDEIDQFLAAYSVSPPPPNSVGANSKWIYSKVALREAPANKLIAIAQELELDPSGSTINTVAPPENWKDARQLRLFISHISKGKDKATRLKECLLPHSISGFVAHEDILPTLEWQIEIERALHTMDAFVAIHTPGFSQSLWTQQEIGFAVGRGVKIISLKMGEDPTGFISKKQALARRGRTAEEIAKEIVDLLERDDRTAAKLKEARRGLSTTFDDEIPFWPSNAERW